MNNTDLNVITGGVSDHPVDKLVRDIIDILTGGGTGPFNPIPEPQL
ncbi:MAG: hypothetical protein AAF433_19300 [Bacteroidota bacterium]